MVLVTGATGHVGWRVATLLAANGVAVRLGARDPDRAPVIDGAEIVRADCADPPSLEAVFGGIERALVIPASGPPGERPRLHRNAFDAAAAAGVAHVVYLSFQGASAESRSAISADHFLSERHLARTGVPWTALRASFYTDLLPSAFGDDGVLRAPAGDGRAAFVAREDVARVAAAVLVGPAPPIGALDVTGPEALSLAEVARVLSVIAGRELGYEPEAPDAARAWRRRLGAPEWQVDAWVETYEAMAAGELDRTSDTVSTLTGRAPIALDAWCAAHPEALAPLRPEADGFPAVFA